MKKYVVISVNENPEYLFYLPLVIWAWKKFGWDVIVMTAFQKSRLTDLCMYTQVPNVEISVNVPEYQSDTVSQISRLYAACGFDTDDVYLMTSDVDMLPLSDYWRFDPSKITVWGHDLTGYQHMPICYIGMNGSRWREVMGLSRNFNDMIKRDLDSMPNAKSIDPVKLWVVDQDLITERINAVQFEKEFIDRGVYSNGYPIGRVDRSAWNDDLGAFVDCHMERGINKNVSALWNMNELLNKVWPQENFDWWIKYINAFNNI